MISEPYWNISDSYNESDIRENRSIHSMASEAAPLLLSWLKAHFNVPGDTFDALYTAYLKDNTEENFQPIRSLISEANLLVFLRERAPNYYTVLCKVDQFKVTDPKTYDCIHDLFSGDCDRLHMN
jgi:hypothetical protein